MKLLLITIAAVLLVGYGSSMSFTEIISNPWALIGILTNYGIMLANLGIVLRRSCTNYSWVFLVEVSFP